MNPFAACGDQWANRTGGKPQERAMNNTSMLTADRKTHLKIVVVSLVCATVVAGIGVTARMTDAGNGRLEATTIKAGAPMTAANGSSQIRLPPPEFPRGFLVPPKDPPTPEAPPPPRARFFSSEGYCDRPYGRYSSNWVPCGAGMRSDG